MKGKIMKIGRGDQEQYLPEELVEEILSILPVKSLLRFRRVLKSWKSLIDSQTFIQKHFKNSSNNTSFPNHRVIMLQSCPDKKREFLHFTVDKYAPKQFNLQSLLNNPSIDPSPMAANVPPSDTGWRLIMGCFNGLVCILDRRDCFFLWNPATGISKKLPPIVDNGPLHIKNTGFGWDESSGAYKVFAVVLTDKCLDYKVYSSETDSWKVVRQRRHGSFIFYGSVSECSSHPIGKYACGKIYWSESYGHNIVSFDLKSEEFRMIEAPCSKARGHFAKLWLGEIGGCLGAVCDDIENSSLDVWVMKESSSWFKLATIRRVYQPGNDCFTLLFGGGSNGEILLSYREKFFIYYPKKNNVFQAPKKFIYSSHEASVYVESLVSPLLLH